jgi:hypothetical protein
MVMEMNLFASMDTDEYGSISQQEFVQVALQRRHEPALRDFFAGVMRHGGAEQRVAVSDDSVKQSSVL